MAVQEGIYTDGSGYKTVTPVAVNSDGQIITSITSLTTADVAVLSTQFPATLTSAGNFKTSLQEVKPGTPTTTSVSSSATSVTVLASNVNRRKVLVYNASTQVLSLSFSTPATTANEFIAMAAADYKVFDVSEIGTGTIYGIWASANGAAQVTEVE